MGLIAVPNVSEGRDAEMLELMAQAIRSAGARPLDTHADGAHNRAVFTVGGAIDSLQEAMVRLAALCSTIDLGEHFGIHPRLGGLDVCPFVPLDAELSDAVDAARTAGARIGEEVGIPVYLYGAAASRAETEHLPDLRRGGLAGLIGRCTEGLAPDFGPPRIDPRKGIVCVGGRRPLVAFNVWLRSDLESARAIAASVRARGDGLPGVRALGLQMDEGACQVSMNLTDPEKAGIDDVFNEVERAARTRGVDVIATEIVGLPPQRLMPDPGRAAARLLLEPGRSLESALGD